MNKILVAVLVVAFLGGAVFVFTVPVEEKFVNDDYIYGGYFCHTFDGSCVSTSGHSTMEELTLFEKWKYERWVRNLKEGGTKK